MKYVPPFGSQDPDGHYIDGQPTLGIQGSVAGAAVFENPQREIVNVIEKSFLEPTDADLMQLAKAIRSKRLNYAEDTGSVNNIAVAYDPPLLAYTRGLQLNVRVRFTNTGATRINAGAGSVPVRKINGAETGAEELPAGAIVTLTFDGTVFQLSNYGGLGGGDVEIFNVKIPYVVDSSPWRDVIIANFAPILDQVAAGDMIAVKIAHTNYGPGTLYVNNLPAAQMRPNGGGMMLQGDLHEGDVVIFIFDGTHWWFAPNPEINSWVLYTCGWGQQFVTPEAAIDALRRKTIGANGFVHLQCAAQVFYAPPERPSVIFLINHPSADRIAIVGTMIGPNPEAGNFAATSNTDGGRYADAVFNYNMLRARYGTVLQLQWSQYPNGTQGIGQNGPGTPTIHNILVLGNRMPVWPQGWAETGFLVWNGSAMNSYNCAAWGCGMGWWFTQGQGVLDRCWTCANTHSGIVSAYASLLQTHRSGAFGNRDHGIASVSSGSIHNYVCHAYQNGSCGVTAESAAMQDTWYLTSWANAYADVYAWGNALVNVAWDYYVGTVSPAWNTSGNLNGLVVRHAGIEFAPPAL